MSKNKTRAKKGVLDEGEAFDRLSGGGARREREVGVLTGGGKGLCVRGGARLGKAENFVVIPKHLRPQGYA